MATKETKTDGDQDLNGVEIFRAGTYEVTDASGKAHKVSYSENDVDTIVANGNHLLASSHYEAPAKLGHSEKQKVLSETGLPAAGWVKNLYRKGSVLLADFKQVPAKLAEAIRRGRYKYVSSEIYDPEDTKRNFGEFGVEGFTLRAVAFLGADVPVVKGLKPLMLSAGVDNARIITLQVEENKIMKKFAEDMADDDKKKLMVPANRHPYGALVKCADDETAAPHVVHAIHPDGKYDVHELHGDGKTKKAVPHENLTLLSEAEYKALTPKETDMDANTVKLAEQKAADAATALAAEKAKNKELTDKARNEKIAAFAEKHKAFGLTAALKPAFEAIATTEVSAPVKLAEGKELPFLDAVLEFAEGLIAAKKVITGEVADTPAEGAEGKDASVKLAEAPYKGYAEQMHVGISGADLACKARSYAEEKKVPYRAALLAVAALNQEEK